MSEAVPVSLNRYRLGCDNSFLGPFGIYHTTIVTHGCEFEYGTSGEDTYLIVVEPGHSCIGYELVGTDLLGTTNLSKNEVVDRLRSVGEQMPAYNFVRSNCNHFATKAAQLLCKSSQPAAYNRIASIVCTFF